MLGPVELRAADRARVPIGGPARRALLARLVIASGETVSDERLIEDLWHGEPPTTAATALRVQVYRLRQAMDAAGDPGGREILVRRPAGYALSLPRSCVDAHCFEDAVDRARAAASAHLQEAVELVEDGLRRWTGAPYADIDDWSFISAETARLEQLRLLALEQRATWCLALGRDAEVASELAQLILEHPLREQLWSLLMLALYRSGRQAEALRAYQDARQHLLDHLGLEPGPALRSVEQAILTQDVSLEQHLPQAVPQPSSRRARSSGRLPPAVVQHRSVPMVGRDDQLAELTGELEQGRVERSRLVLLIGEPGIGKTRLAAELAGRAADLGAQVLYGRCDEEPIDPYQPFVEALQHYVARCDPDLLGSDLSLAGPEVVRLVPELRRRIGDLPDPAAGGTAGDRYRLFESVAGILSAAARRHPVVLVLDDLQWADRPTSLLLRHLLRLPPDVALLIVATLRSTEPQDELLQAVLTSAHRDCRTKRLHLLGLDASSVEELITRVTGERPGPSLAAELRARTGGNPLFIEALSAEMFGEEGRRSALSETLQDSINNRVVRLPPATRRWLDVAVVAGEHFRADLVGGVFGSEEEALSALEGAVAAGLVTPAPLPGAYLFSHAVVRETLYQQVGGARRAKLHHQLGEALTPSASHGDADLAEAARHLVIAAAGGVGDPARAAAAALRAAELAMRQLSFEGAAAHVESALALLSVEEQPELFCQLLVASGEALYRAGDRDRSQQQFWRAAEHSRDRWPELFARAAVGFCSVSELGMADRPDDASYHILDEAYRSCPDVPVVLRVQVLSRLARESHYRQDRPRCLALSDEIIKLAATVDDAQTRAIALYNRRWRFPDQAELRARSHLSAEALNGLGPRGDDEVRFLLHRFRVGALLELSDVDGARVEVEECRALSRRLRQPVYVGQVRRFDTMLALLDGRLEEARSLISTPLPEDAKADVGAVASQLLVLEWLQGGLGPFVKAASAMTAERPWLPVFRAAECLVLAEAGRVVEAAERCDSFAAEVLPNVPDDENLLLTMVLLGHASAHLDRPETSRLLHRLIRPYAQRAVVTGSGDACLGSAGLAAGILAAGSGELDEAVEHLQAALEHNLDLGVRPFVVLNRLELARVLLDRGTRRHRATARPVLDDALDEARAMGMRPAVDRLERLLGRLPRG